VFIYLIVALLGLSYLWFKRRYTYWAKRGFLSPSTFVPFGTMKGVASEITHAEKSLQHYRQFKGKTPVIGIYVFGAPMILPLDLELIKNILVRDFSSFHDRGFYYNKEDQPVSAK
jgi:cytochrome P450 family 6